MHLSTVDSMTGSLPTYLSEIRQLPVLNVEEEQRLARRYVQFGDESAARALVTGNLRFVVKIAYEYRSFGLRMADLIQEGNIGLMRAVQKFDPDKQIRLISYGVWWIRAYIQNHILKSWSLVKMGTTQAQRKLFFSLARTRREIEKLHQFSDSSDEVRQIARRLHVKTTEVVDMQQRMHGRDVSLDAPLDDDGASARLDFLAAPSMSPDDTIADAEEHHLVHEHVLRALGHLDARERYIVEQRLMSDRPMTLKALGEHFGFSRERARQLEIRACEKLRHELRIEMGELVQSYRAAA